MPNAITVLRLLLVIPIVALLVHGAAPLLALILLAGFGASDWMDGYLARRLGQTSRTGALLDPVADRVGVVVIAAAFVVTGHLSLWIAAVVAAADLILGVAYLIARPVRIPAVSLLGKARTGVLMTGFALTGAGLLPALDTVAPVGQLVCAAGAVLHVLACVGYLRGSGGLPRTGSQNAESFRSFSPVHVSSQNMGMTSSAPAPKQLRLIIETDDFDRAVRFYRDVLGMPEQAAFATAGDDRVAILQAGIATIELATPTHSKNIDDVEGAPHTPGVLRIALEVDDTEQAVAAASDGGADLIAPPVMTPFRSLNARVQGPAGWQVTFFQELETLEERAAREGFTTDDGRDR
ncbi:CDP-alcohol phosphatidyltransferase family protein [Cellulomonas wangsupingiae]|uniref:CDP-alcohol phosphatidyltransferase family protein n=1 Tax=Cellulomonas wangsupingiae TaxID=2968085 RepID=UPI001D0E7AFD|nr:CDP-alcohol phosphatidyltransferase family protein [Cellulomonas wangsupingiae]MCM0639339.1 CDP-alcohol phosphatidyltransferase family protein [Cellulomonas wangsupingiae]